jgi:hypothetical protein
MIGTPCRLHPDPLCLHRALQQLYDVRRQRLPQRNDEPWAKLSKAPGCAVGKRQEPDRDRTKSGLDHVSGAVLREIIDLVAQFDCGLARHRERLSPALTASGVADLVEEGSRRLRDVGGVGDAARASRQCLKGDVRSVRLNENGGDAGQSHGLLSRQGAKSGARRNRPGTGRLCTLRYTADDSTLGDAN